MGDDQSNATIMIVDDMPDNLRLLRDILQEQGYRIMAFPRGDLALEAARKKPPDLIFLDILMPGIDGYEMCTRLKTDPRLAEIPVLFISALNDPESKVRAFGLGGVDYVAKPFQPEEVLARTATHLRLRALRDELREHNNRLEQQVQAQVREITQSHLAISHALSELMETRDFETPEHIARTRQYCALLARRLRDDYRYALAVDDMFVDSIHQAAPMHDIGKFGIPESILLKPGKLSLEEFESIKSHTTIGALTLKKAAERQPDSGFLRMAVAIARWHHEKWDGTGYPDGLAGENIPLSARIMAVADVYDTLRSRRPYKPAFSHEESVRTMREASATHFDPRLVQAFEDVAPRFSDIYEQSAGMKAEAATGMKAGKAAP